ncbi:MAG TPA: ABC transporter permease subunit [Magnetospirillaceae bacterium]
MTPLFHRLLSIAVTIAVVVGVWWAVVVGLELDPLSAKTPLDVWHYLISAQDAGDHRLAMAEALAATLRDAALGFLMGVVAGCALAAATSLSRLARHAILPVAMVLRSVPLAALSPIITLVFGQGVMAVTVVAAVVVFFPTFVNVLVGLASASKEATELLRAYGATPAQTFRKVRVPAAIPALMASARIAVPGSLIGVLVAEWLVSGDGIGQFMIWAQDTLDYAALWSAAVVLTVTSVVLYALVGAVEKRVLPLVAAPGVR